jgi:hypothetical protein
MTTLIFDLPDDLALAPHAPPSEIADELRLAAALHLHQQGRLSIQDDARLAGLAPAGFFGEARRTRRSRFPAPADLPAAVEPTGILDLDRLDLPALRHVRRQRLPLRRGSRGQASRRLLVQILVDDFVRGCFYYGIMGRRELKCA